MIIVLEFIPASMATLVPLLTHSRSNDDAFTGVGVGLRPQFVFNLSGAPLAARIMFVLKFIELAAEREKHTNSTIENKVLDQGLKSKLGRWRTNLPAKMHVARYLGRR